MSCKFIVYEKGNEIDKREFEEFEFPFEMRVYDIRSEIMWRLFVGDRQIQNEKYYLEMVNITPKIYKDFGKQFFDMGHLPKSIDNAPLSKFSSFERTFEFIVYRVERKNLIDYTPVKELTRSEHEALNDSMRRIEERKYERARIEEEAAKNRDKEEADKKKREEEDNDSYSNIHANHYSSLSKKNKYDDNEW